jgi:hypothetical protein
MANVVAGDGSSGALASAAKLAKSKAAGVSSKKASMVAQAKASLAGVCVRAGVGWVDGWFCGHIIGSASARRRNEISAAKWR